jgi:hypothetical protein
VLLEYGTELVPSILTATITVEDQLLFALDPALRSGHPHGIDDQIAPHVRLHRPSHYFTAEQVYDNRQKQPAFIGRNIGDISVRSCRWRWSQARSEFNFLKTKV